MVNKKISLFWAVWWTIFGLLVLMAAAALITQISMRGMDRQTCPADALRPHADEQFQKIFSEQPSNQASGTSNEEQLQRIINIQVNERKDSSVFTLQTPLLSPQFGKAHPGDSVNDFELRDWDENLEGSVSLSKTLTAQLVLIQKQALSPIENENFRGEPVWPGPTAWNLSGEVASPDELDRIKNWSPPLNWNSMPVHQKFPNYRFWFELTDNSERVEEKLDYKALDLHVWDLETHYNLTAAASMTQMQSVSGQRFSITQSVGLWRKSPVRLALDLAVGPVNFIEFDPEKIMEAETMHVRPGVSLISVAAGRVQRFSRLQEDKVSWELLVEEATAERLTLVFLDLTESKSAPWNVEALNGSGRNLNILDRGNSGNLIFKEVITDGDKLESVRIGNFSHYYRIFWDLKQLPSMPEANDQLDGLFEQRIPYLKVRNEQDVENFLESALQLKKFNDSFSKNTVPPVWFPQTFQNVTVREILNQWILAKREEGRVVYDPDNFVMEFRPPTLQAWYEWLKQAL